jgi:hypothetical protein
MTKTDPSWTRPTPDEVEGFIGTLETSFTYDPPERWQHAHKRLRELRQQFRAAYAPFVWLELAGLVLLVVASIAVLFSYFAWPPWSAGYAWVAPILIPALFSGLAHVLARRREPLLRYESKVDDACRKFDKLVAERDNAPA